METKTLTIEQLAPYLPYGLKGTYTLSDVVKLPNGAKDEVREKILDIENPKFFLTYCKPILRPLSDLTPYENGEIDGMGETNDFILIRLVDETNQHCDAYDEWRDSYFDNPEPSRILQAPYEVFQELVKQHYDVFNLIPNGLAIDSNTISHE